MIAGLLCALVAAAFYGVAAVLQAAAARRVPRASGVDPRVLLRLLRHPPAVIAILLLLIGFVLHVMSVRLLPLFLAQAGIAVSLVVTALLAVAVVGERLTRLEWSAVVAVLAGLLLLSASSGHIGDDGDAWIPVALLGAVAAIALAALPVTRTRSALAAGVLGLLAGLAYGIVGIAARLLPGWSAGQLAGSLPAYVLGLSGLLAFYLYTLALQRGAVTIATAPLIVAQTVAPAAVGLLQLGDAVRPGWAAGAAAGFTVTVIAAASLVRFEGAPGPAQRSTGHQENGRTVIG